MTLEERIKEKLEEFWKDMQLGPSATLVRIAFQQGYLAGMKDKTIPSREKYEYMKKL